MSVKIRRYGKNEWEVDIRIRLPNGERLRDRVKAPTQSKTAAARWAADRERELLLNGKPKKTEVREVPTLKAFGERFLDDAKANQQKPSTIAAKEMILRVHLIPQLGDLRLDAITTEEVQRLKATVATKAPKTVNNILTVLNVLLKTAQGWRVVDLLPCQIKLLRAGRTSSAFYDFDEYERLVKAAEIEGGVSRLIVLLGGDAGLRCGEMMALQWADVDLTNRQICINRSDWNGHVTSPKGGRLRRVPLTKRLAAALNQHRHLRSPRVLCGEDAKPLTRQMVQSRVKRLSRQVGLSHEGVHILRHSFCSHLAMRGAPARAIQELAGHRDLSMTQQYMHLSPAALDSAIRLLEQPVLRNGEMVETATGHTARAN